MTALAVEVELRDGRRLRFGPDERDIGDIPKAISFDTELPGGFGPANITLPRPDVLSTTDAELFASTRIYDAYTNQTYHEGRIVGMPRSGANEIQLEAEGWAKHLADDETARQIFYDRDFSSWGAPSNPRVDDVTGPEDAPGPLDKIEAGAPTDDPMLAYGVPAFETAVSGEWFIGAHSEGWYDTGPARIPIAAVDYSFTTDTVDSGDILWVWRLFLTADDRISDFGAGADETGNLSSYPTLGGSSGAGTLNATSLTHRFGVVALEYASAGGTTEARPKFSIIWFLLAVIGDHGLPLVGNVTTDQFDLGRGLLASDIVPYVISTWAPLLRTTSQSIETTSWKIPHLTFKEHTTALAMLQGLSVLGGNTSYPMDWGVFENRTFHYKSPGSLGRTWQVRRGDATLQSDDGPDAASRLNGVVVRYDDGTGRTRTVGPPGSNSEYETAVLADTDPTNPANQDGARHWKVIDGGINEAITPGMSEAQADQTGAVMMGRLMMAQANREEWRGSVTVVGDVHDDAGNVFPAAMIRAGDELVVVDDPDTRPRRIVGTSFTGNTCTVSIGARPDVLEVAMSRIGASIVSGIGMTPPAPPPAPTAPAGLRAVPPKGGLVGPSGVPGGVAR